MSVHRVRSRWGVSRVAVLLIAVMVVAIAPWRAQAQRPGPDVDVRVDRPAEGAVSSAVPRSRRAEVLGQGWRSSSDRAWLTSGDADGFHILVADAADGFGWRTIATLSEPGFAVDRWIGNACVTESGDRAVVAYAPRTFTNEPELMRRGAFTAVVDLADGSVTKLAVQSTLAYFSPSCGAGERAVFTQSSDELGRTRLVEVDAATARVRTRIETAGQLTSAVPTDHGIVAADSGGLVRVAEDGTRRVLAPATGVPFKVAADSDGGVVFMERVRDARTRVRRATTAPRKGSSRARTVTTVATGALTDVDVTSGKAGRVFVTGGAKPGAPTPASVSLVEVPKGSRMSMQGTLAVTSARAEKASSTDPGAPEPLRVAGTVLTTGKTVEFSVSPDANGTGGNDPMAGRTLSPAIRTSGVRTMSDPHDPADYDERYCSVPRADPRNQAMQPKPRQVEWAVDQAVRGVLDVRRPENWKNLGMPSYTPQGLFPSIPLSGGGHVPAQIMLGVAAQESNLWQAARSAVPGVTGNPLIGNYFGIDYYNDTESDDWTINWAEADCGYGVTQVTDGMRLAGKERPGETAMPYQKQRAVALDFAANVAAGLRILQTKWNQTRDAGLVINNGDPSKIENWFYAVWAYNSGFHAPQGDGSAWGVGWLNNPVNPIYPANRDPFLEFTYEDAAHPQDWPYPEKVMGWAGHPVEVLEAPGELVAGFRPAWWNGDATTGPLNRQRVKPPVTQFCDASNDCVPGEKFLPDAPEVVGEPAGPCAHTNADGQYDLKCWYHEPSTWKEDCDYTCGNELLRFDPGYPYQEDATSYPPRCDLSGLPANVLVVDDVGDDVPSIRPNCERTWSNAGDFEFTFKQHTDGTYPGKVDIHQIGGGFGGHFWFSHTRTADAEGGKLEATGTWSFDQPVNGWARVLVHMPDHGAHTQQAHYEIDTGSGSFTEDRYLSQGTEAHRWVSAGVYPFTGNPRVRLSSETQDGYGEEDVAWDAVAIQPLPDKPDHIVAALGDSFSSGEGAGNYYTETDNNHGTPRWAACRRSRDAWARKMVLPGMGESLGAHADRFDPDAELGFVACSGALTHNLLGDVQPASWSDPDAYYTGEGQFREMAQIKSGVLSEHTTLVTLSVGGNDAGFTDAMMECAGLSNCANDEEFVPKYKSNIDQTQPRIEEVLRRIAQRAPNAQIVLMGYPEIFSRTVKCAGSWYFDMTEVEALAELANYMAQEEAATVGRVAADGIDVAFANPIPAFVGHGACDEVEWLNKIVSGPNGDGDFHDGDRNATCLWWPGDGPCLSRESFHPNDAGTTGYARVMETRLAEVGYGGS